MTFDPTRRIVQPARAAGQTLSRNYTRTDQKMPPKDAPIEWITPTGRTVEGRWLGGAVWMPKGSDSYVYYTPVFWRLCS
jgi:hypothetical protein